MKLKQLNKSAQQRRPAEHHETERTVFLLTVHTCISDSGRNFSISL